MTTKEHRYWINTVSRDPVLIGIKGGFTLANHGNTVVGAQTG